MFIVPVTTNNMLLSIDLSLSRRTVVPGVQVVHAASVEAPVRLLTVHRHRVPVLPRAQAQAGQAGQGSHWRTWRDPGHVEAVHGHGESVYGLVVQSLPALLIAGLQAEDEDDDGHDDADHDGGGGRDDDVVESLGAAANSLRPDLATLLERDGAGSDLHLLQ